MIHHASPDSSKNIVREFGKLHWVIFLNFNEIMLGTAGISLHYNKLHSLLSIPLEINKLSKGLHRGFRVKLMFVYCIICSFRL